jgi:hypothetical protein
MVPEDNPVLGRVRLLRSAIILGLIGQSRQAKLVREQGQTRPGIAPVGRQGLASTEVVEFR